MKTVLLVLAVFLAAAPVMAQTYVSGDILTPQVWTPAGSPYIIQSDVAVTGGSGSLTIESTPSAGVTVAFDGYYYLNTQGNGFIVATGHADHPVVFTSNASTPAESDWVWMNISGAVPSSFTHCVIEYAQMGIRCNGGDATISHCVIRHCSEGVFCLNASPAVEYCDIYDNDDGIQVLYSSTPTLPVINYCNIYGNTDYNLRVVAYPAPGVTIDAENNWWGTDVEGEIQQKIRDSTDNPDIYVTVDYTPWWSEQPVDASTWSRIKSMFSE